MKRTLNFDQFINENSYERPPYWAEMLLFHIYEIIPKLKDSKWRRGVGDWWYLSGKDEVVPSNWYDFPGGGIWTFENVKDIDTLIANKDSLISMACSGKNVTKLHRVRRRIFDSFLFDDRVTLFGPPISNPQNSDNMLTKFCISNIVENHLDHH
jgi:hypothetical protein